MMRKHLFFAAALLALASCTREVSVDVPGGDVTLVALTEGSATKTIVEGETHVYWEPGDEIKVFVGENAAKFTTDITASAATASFTGSLDVPAGADLWAAYPYSEDAVFSGETITLVLPSEQVARAGSFGKDMNLAIAHSTSNTLQFYHVGGGARFTVANEGITAVTFKANHGEALAGKVEVGLEGVPVLKSVLGGVSEVTVHAPEGGFVPGQYYFAAFLPQTLSEGMSLTFRRADGKVARTSLDKSITIHRSRFGKLDEKDKGLEFREDDLDLIRRVLMALYDALDGPNWRNHDGWGTDEPVSAWDNVSYNPADGTFSLDFNGQGLNGEIPDCIGELGGLLTGLTFYLEPGIKGTLPDSFRKLVNLRSLFIVRTSMTSLPDVFEGMKSLVNVTINSNEEMTGPLPESIGSSPVLERLSLVTDRFTGELPASWGRLNGKFLVGENCLTGKLPDSILATEEYVWLQEEVLPQRDGFGFDISDVDLHGGRFWPEGMVEDLVGNSFSFDDIVGKNKCTVYLNWSLWDPFSRPLMTDLKELYDLYHEDGLDIIATVMTSEDGISREAQKNEILKRGYDRWHNYYYPAYIKGFTPNLVPIAEVYDSNGYILFSGFSTFPDPVRNRFSRSASIDLVPFLLGIFEKEPYTSTDYSMDGEVRTLQTATVGKGINIVFMGDAFTDRDMGAGGLYETLMEQSMEEFFEIEPYKTFRNRFNVYEVKVVSPNGRIGDGYTTALETVTGDGTYILGNADKCEVYSLKVPSITSTDNLLTCVMVKNSKYAGTCTMSRFAQSAVAFTATEGYDRDLFGNTLRHEAGGHGFAFLSDEYAYYDETIPDDKKEDYMYRYDQFGWYSNVDFTNDPNLVHWSAFLSDSRYRDEVGVFEGGALYTTGIWRPSEDSMMNNNVEYFNAPSRWAIYKRIMELSGEEYSFDTFLAYDAVNRGQASAAVARPPLMAGKAAAHSHKHTAPPVVLP